MLQEMPLRLLQSDLFSCVAVISAYKKGMQWEKTALGLLQEMPRRSLQPDVISFDATISACEEGM